MFAWVSIPSGQTLSVRRSVSPVVIRALRGRTRAPVLVSAELSDRAGHQTVANATRTFAGAPR